ncbi:Dapdiamide A synthase [Pandoraea horticolens]|uniref:Dapdiamide A synthase n=1 Tax=Pandoraea horticolens TaxID=2508298 RepID=A0A5E4ZCZ5_9BURK|nr:ATP-grasp domain-containing protein [Pandoraea horticolens]VVE58906.1 Dapdiamide A synthase [Pandoraea horticolens]
MASNAKSFVLSVDTLGATADLLLSAAQFHQQGLIILTPAPDRVLDEIGHEHAHASALAVVQVDFSKPLEVKQVAHELAKRLRISGILVQSDRAAVLGATIAQELGLPAHPVTAMRVCRDKSQTRRALAAAGVKSILFSEVMSVESALEKAETFGYPMIVKDPSGTGSANVFIVNDADELGQAVAAILATRDSVLLEEFLKGPLYSAECVIRNGNVAILGYSNRELTDFPDFNELGLTFPSDIASAWKEKTETYIESITKAVGLSNGFAHIEFILTTDGPQVVEVNPRMGGIGLGRMLSLALGDNVFKVAIAICLGLTPPVTMPLRSVHIGCKILGAKTTGRIRSIRGVNALTGFPGFMSLSLVRREGDTIASARDYRNTVGYLLTTGETPTLAYDYARAAAATIVIETDNL